MFKLLFLFVAGSAAQPQLPSYSLSGFQSHYVACGCLCMDGMARTLCQSVTEAQRQPNMCPPDLQCPRPEVSDESSPPAYFDAPADFSRNCREVRIWDAEVEAYTGVKVCDVYTG